jgi:hypothetical protein
MYKIFVFSLMMLSFLSQAEPSLSYWKHERHRLHADDHQLVLTEHLIEERPIFYTIHILDEQGAEVAHFQQCAHTSSVEPREIRVVCGNGISRAEVVIQNATPYHVTARWEQANKAIQFSQR